MKKIFISLFVSAIILTGCTVEKNNKTDIEMLPYQAQSTSTSTSTTAIVTTPSKPITTTTTTKKTTKVTTSKQTTAKKATDNKKIIQSNEEIFSIFNNRNFYWVQVGEKQEDYANRITNGEYKVKVEYNDGYSINTGVMTYKSPNIFIITNSDKYSSSLGLFNCKMDFVKQMNNDIIGQVVECRLGTLYTYNGLTLGIKKYEDAAEIYNYLYNYISSNYSIYSSNTNGTYWSTTIDIGDWHEMTALTLQQDPEKGYIIRAYFY